MTDEEKLEPLIKSKKEYKRLGYWGQEGNYLHNAIQKTLDNFGVKDDTTPLL